MMAPVLPTRSARARYALVVAALAVLWVLIEKLGASVADRYTSAQIVVLRYGIHLLLLAVICLRAGLPRLWATRQRAAQLARGTCMFLMPFFFIVGGAYGLGATELWSTFWIAPLLIIVISKRWLRERAGRVIWVVLALGYAGALLALRGVPVLGSAGFWPLVSAVTFSVYVVMSRRLREETIESSLFYTSLVAFACMLPFAVPYWQPIELRDVPSIAGIGIVGLALLTLLDRVVEIVPATLFAPCLYFVVLVEALYGALQSAAVPSKSLLLGVALLVAAVVLQLRSLTPRGVRAAPTGVVLSHGEGND